MNQGHRIYLSIALLACTSIGHVHAQYATNNAQADQYLADIVDGGPAASRFTTRIRITNNALLTTQPATGTITFWGDDGNPLALDFAPIGSLSDPQSSVSFSIPPGGSFSIESRGSAPAIRQGWAQIYSSVPVEVTAEFRNFQNGVLANAASVNGSTPNSQYWYTADAYSGLAIGNPDPAVGRNCTIAFRDNNGNVIASKTITLGPAQHTALGASSLGTIPTTAIGSLFVACTDPSGNRQAVISLGINGSALGITSALPDSSMTSPVRHYEDVEKQFNYLLSVIASNSVLSSYASYFSTPPLLSIGGLSNFATCYGYRGAATCATGSDSIVWSTGFGDLLSEPNEIAFVLAHELGHLVQHRLAGASGGFTQIFPASPTNTDVETDADIFGMMVMIAGRQNPWGAAGALGKITAIVPPPAIPNALAYPKFDPNITLTGTNMNASLLNRVNSTQALINVACGTLPAVNCQVNHIFVNPDLPAGAGAP